ncbi:MAG: amino acid permease [bacterium]
MSLGALLLALSFSRLSRSIPRAGGPYAYTREAFGDFAGFLVAWGYWIAIFVGNAAIAVGFVGYTAFFFPSLSAHPPLAVAVALAAIWLLTWTNALGVREAGFVQLVTTVLKLLPLAAVGLLGILYLDPSHFRPFNLAGGSAMGAVRATATLTLWAFIGLESATVPAENVKDPERTIPRATVAGTLATALIYMVSTAAVLGIVPPEALAVSTAPFAEAAAIVWGPWASRVVAAGAAISAFGALNGWILLQGQVPLAAARDGLFPERFARLSPRGTPLFGLVVSSVLVTLLMAMNYTRGLVEQYTLIILLATLTTLVPYVFSTAAEGMLILRRRIVGEPLPLGRVLLLALAFIYALWAVAGSGAETVYWGFLLLLAGLPVYVLIRGGDAA